MQPAKKLHVCLHRFSCKPVGIQNLENVVQTLYVVTWTDLLKHFHSLLPSVVIIKQESCKGWSLQTC